ncbi:MAG: translocation/assembly module TamB domain-containing protein, partial [Cyanobacteriota bacterium]
ASLMDAALTRDLSGIRLDAGGRLAIADGTAQVQAQVANGQLESNFSAANIALNPYLPNLRATVGLMSAAGTARLSLANVLGILDSGDLSRLNPELTTEAQLALNQGSGTVVAAVTGGQWHVTTDANLPVDDALVQELIGDRIVTSPRFPTTLLAQANLSGPLNPLLELGAVPIPAQVNRLTANIDGDLLQAQGDVLLSHLRQTPDLAANLTLEANYDSQRLPLTLLLADVAVGENLKRPSPVNIDGSVAVSGQFQGRQLLSNPLGEGNLNLAGGVELRDFAVNEVEFDPLMAGTVQVRTGGTLALALQGPGRESDRLAVALEACQQGSRCLAPYLPRDFEIRKAVNGEVVFSALGERLGDRFAMSLDDFNLALLDLVPGQALGIIGPVRGQVTGEIVTDLFTLQTRGGVSVANPGLGYLRAEAIAAEFGYDGQETVIRDGVLQLRDSRFVLNAATQLDLLGVVQGRIPLAAWQQAPVQAELTVDSGNVGDLLTTVAWYDIEDLLRRGVASPSLDPQDLTATGVGIPKHPLAEQLALFDRIRQQVIERVTPPGEPQPPQVAEIEGTYTAAVTLGGTLGNPNLTADLAASDWVWYTQPPSPLATSEPRPRLTLDDLRVRASFVDNVLTVEQARVQAEGGEASLMGRVSPTQLEGGFEVVDVPLDLLERFVSLPVTLGGDLRLQGRFGGTVQQPTLLGEVAIESPQLNDRSLESFLGNFRYGGDRVEFVTVAPSWSQIQVSVPFPLTALTPETAIAQGRISLDTPAFELVEALSEGQVVWLGGEGRVDVAARVDLMALTSGEIERILQSFEAEGAIAFDQAQVEAAALPEAQSQIDGVIRFNQEQLDVEGLVAQVADGSFRLAGVLPLLEPNPDLERPLTLTVDQGAIALAGLYEGRLDGDITVAGTVLTPVVRGGIELSQGRVSVPGGELAAGGMMSDSSSVPSSETRSEATSPLIMPVLDGFRVSLGEDLRIVNSLPSFNARVAGDVTVNGVIDGDLGNLNPQGTIRVEEGQLNVLSSVFFVTPGRPQTVEFIPEEGLFNPRLDVQVSTLVSEQRRNPMADRDRNSNEVPDTTILPLRQSRQLLVNITIDAMTEDVLDAILADSSGEVTVQGFEPNEALLDTVQLSSVPNRSENELVSLLGGQVVTTIDEIGQLRGTEFFEYALVRFVLEPELTGLLVDIDRVANQAGDAIGLDRLSVFPIGQIEAIYELNERSLLGLTYDYGLSGFLLQGGQTESGTPGFESIEIRYELRF